MKLHLSRLKEILKKRKKLLIGVVLLILVLSAGFWQYSAVQTRRQTALDQFHKQQEDKRTELQQDFNQIQEAERERLAKEHEEDRRQLEENTNIAFSTPNCSTLRDRPAVIVINDSCSYRLRAKGKSTMAVVLIQDSSSDISQDRLQQLINPSGDENSLSYINTYLKREAARNGVSPPEIKITPFGPYTVSETISHLYYRDNMSKFLEVFDKTSKAHKVPESDFDMVHYIYLRNDHGGAAISSVHRAFTTAGPAAVPVFIHETLHLFEATDKYNNNDCNTIGRADPFNSSAETQGLIDIMCQSFDPNNSIINKITAREIGW